VIEFLYRLELESVYSPLGSEARSQLGKTKFHEKEIKNLLSHILMEIPAKLHLLQHVLRFIEYVTVLQQRLKVTKFKFLENITLALLSFSFSLPLSFFDLNCPKSIYWTTINKNNGFLFAGRFTVFSATVRGKRRTHK
jgi:hypothetical protein